MEIKTGMYVRTNGGNIVKIESFVSSLQNDFIKTSYEEYINKKDIKKASFNLIDLIEIGDYVNGHKVIYVEDLDALEYLFIDSDGNSYYSAIDKECNKPKSIVTHEQFDSMKYEVK